MFLTMLKNYEFIIIYLSGAQGLEEADNKIKHTT